MELKEALAEIEALKADGETKDAAIVKANDEASFHRKSKKEAKDKLAAFDGFDAEELKALKGKAAQLEQDKLKEAGKFEEALEKGLAGSKAEIESLKDLISGKDGKLSKVLIDNAVLSAIDGKAVNNEQVLALIRGNIKMDGDSPVVMNGDAPRVDDKGNHVSVADYALSFLADNAHLAQPSGGGSGSRGNNGNNNQGGKTMPRADFDNLDATAQSAFIKDGGIPKD